MKFFGLEIKLVRVKEPKQCPHKNARPVDLSGGIYQCPTCKLGCVYINGKLTALNFDNLGGGV